MTGSLDQDGVGIGMQRLQDYFCTLLSHRYIGFASASGIGFCCKALSVSARAMKNI